jgi:hypothetical protein
MFAISPDRENEEKPAEQACAMAITSGRSNRDAYRTSSAKSTRPRGESTRKRFRRSRSGEGSYFGMHAPYPCDELDPQGPLAGMDERPRACGSRIGR